MGGPGAARRDARPPPAGVCDSHSLSQDPWPEEGFRSGAEPGQTQPDTLMGCRECKEGEAGERGEWLSEASSSWEMAKDPPFLGSHLSGRPDRFNPLRYK